MEALSRTRAVLKGKLTRFQTFTTKVKASYDDPSQQIPPEQFAQLQKRLSDANQFLFEFQEIHAQIINVCTDVGAEDVQFEQFETDFYDAISKAETLVNHMNMDTGSNHIHSSNSPNIIHSNHAGSSFIKLPTINLPKFCGNIENWIEFRETYNSLIHENSSITDIQKLHYLKASLSGEAADLIKSLEFTANNYTVAWDSVRERYNNPRMLVHNHLKAILGLESLSKESASKLRKIRDTLFKHVTALESLATEKELLHTFLIYSISKKLDPTTSREWETLKNTLGSKLPTLDQFKEFLKNTANLLESLETKTAKFVIEKPKAHFKSFIASTPTCVLCNDSHNLYNCEKFQELSPQERLAKAKEFKVCLNCLSKGHFVPQCASKYTCRQCKCKHHSLLHLKPAQPSLAQPVAAIATEASAEPSQVFSAFSSNQTQVLLPTAAAQIMDSAGNPHSIRILLDSGSQSNFIRASLCRRMNLTMRDANISISGLSKVTSHIRSRCDVELRAHHSPFKTNLSCLVLDEITGTMPSFYVDRNKFQIPDNIVLSDLAYDRPGDIDLLIGAPIFFKLLCIGQIHLGPNMPTLQSTRFGWVISGPTGFVSNPVVQCHFSRYDDPPDQLTRFWELENYPSDKVLSKEENACETHFSKHVRRDSNGRFIVSIPFKDSVEALGDSLEIAQKRFFSLEKRLQADPNLSTRYGSFMKEYEELGHMSAVIPTHSDIAYYLPHHGVLKEDSLTTKLRVVFNGSMPTTTGLSLNSIQMVGPTLQPDLFSILVRFRQHTYAISADIEKMYRQVLVEPAQRPLQRILWRPDPTKPLQTYELNTVTYGTASASFLAIRSLTQLGIDCEASHPEISSIIKQDFYVDDLLTGTDDLELASKICAQLSAILNAGCLKLRKWVSNNPQVLVNIPEVDLHPGVLDFGSHERTHTLGLIWSFQSDHLMYSISKSAIATITKRTILSEISQIFDPLGLLSPCTLGAKSILQQIWIEKLSWDEPVPNQLEIRWTSYREELLDLNDLKIPRHVLCPNPINIQMHGFSDASLRGYGACLYLRSVDQHGQVHVQLLCAKSKVSPLKPITIPKLELSGACLLSKLLNQVRKDLRLQISNCVLWTDSSIVLGWLKTSPNLLKPFVCNRVADIQELNPDVIWRHVPTKSNPADLLSRGVSPQLLKGSDLWWNGPSFLRQDVTSWPTSTFSNPTLPELKGEMQCHAISLPSAFPINDFSNFSRLKRVVAYCLRFIKNCSLQNGRSLGPLTPEELQHSLLTLVRIAQRDSFAEEVKQLKQSKQLKSSSTLISLNPFLDSEGLLRVGGRLRHSNYSFDKKHPLLLSGKHNLAKLLVTHEHIRLLHAGPQLLLSCLRDQFWLTSSRNLVKKVVHSCVRCFRFSSKTSKPIMGNLPIDRVEPSPPFHVTGVDYAGPFPFKDRKGRGAKISKSYLCIFVCFTSKAVHLELVTDLSTATFLLAFRRFVARRGKPLHVYSDNGTNFVGANNELRELGTFLINQSSAIPETVATEGTSWHFIPAHSPHFGGLWEAGVKSSKHHIKRVIGSCILNFEELCTLFSQVEATLNSRPIAPLSADPNDLQPLTPAHFLIGRPLTSLPDPDVTHIAETRLSKFQRIQQINQHFWQRWSKEYLSELQQRPKWRTQQSHLQPKMLVLIKEDNLPPLHWKLGRIENVHPGSDGIARVASVRTHNGIVRRSFAKLCPLPIDKSDL